MNAKADVLIFSELKFFCCDRTKSAFYFTAGLIFILAMLIFNPVINVQAAEINISDDPEYILGGHTLPLNSVSWSPDGEWIASPGPEGDILISKAETGNTTKVLTGHEDNINELSWAANSKILVSASTDNTVRSWDVETGENLAKFTGHDDWVLSVDISPGENIAASGGWDSTIYLWDITTGETLTELTSPGGWVRKISWSPDGELLAAGTNDRSYIWNTEDNEIVYTLGDNRKRVRALAWLNNGKKFALGDDDGNIRIHRLQQPEETELLLDKTIDGRRITSLAPDSTGTKLAATGNFNDIIILDTESYQIDKELTGHGNYVNQTSWSPDRNKLASASQDGNVKIWDVSGETATITLSGHQEVITSVQFSPDSQRLVTGSEDRRIRIWDPPSPELQQSLRGHTAAIRSLSWSPDGTRLASGSEDQALIVWQADTSPEPQFVAGDHRDRTLFDWEAFLPRERKETTHEDWIFHVEWSPDGNYIASASYDGSAGIWQAKDGEAWQKLDHEEGWVRQITWAPSSQETISIGEKGGIHHWDIAGNLKQQINSEAPELRAAAFNPAGTLVALSNYENTTQILSYPDFTVLDEIQTHEGLTFDLTWSPEGQYLATAGEDKKIALWDVDEESGEINNISTQNLPGFSGRSPRSIDWSHDGSYLASHDGHYLLLWRLESTR